MEVFLIAAVLRQLDFDASEVRITWSVKSSGYWTLVQCRDGAGI
jgi:hypothetical protein